MDYSKVKARIRKKKLPRMFPSLTTGVVMEMNNNQQQKPTEAKICVMCRCHTECTNCKDEQASPLSSKTCSSSFLISNKYLSAAATATSLSSSSSSAEAEPSFLSSSSSEAESSETKSSTSSSSSSNLNSNTNIYKKYSNLSEVKSSMMFRTSLVTNSCGDNSGKSRQNHLLKQRILSLFVILISMNLLTTLLISTITIKGVYAAVGGSNGEVRLKKQEGHGEFNLSLTGNSGRFIQFLYTIVGTIL